MRHPFALIAIALSVLIANPAAASDSGLSAGTEMSAAKKKKPRAAQPYEAAPALAARRGWFDPSLGPDGKPYRNPYPPGTCSVDQGYGRFTTCDFHE
jgi:hypothetical protein